MKSFSRFKIICEMVIVVLLCGMNSVIACAEEMKEPTNEVPEIYIKAINPGYTIDGINNVGEMIEIGRTKSDAPMSLAGLTVGYTNSSGNYSTLVEFPENSYLVGEVILLRLASSPDGELAAETYTKTLAFKAGPLVLKRGDEVIDSVCWTGKEGCAEVFKSATPTTLVRNLETDMFEHVFNYEPSFKRDDYLIKKDEKELEDGYGQVTESQCKGLVFSEILSYYDESKTEQFIEFYNTASEQILLDGCEIKYKNKTYPLKGILKPEKYYARYLGDFNITKNPTNFNTIELLDINGEVLDEIDYPNGQRKGASYALIGYNDKGEEIWRTTYAPTPNEANNYQEFKSCEEGKVINEATGNCVKVAVVTEKVCPVGQFLNPLTGRCKKIEVAKSVTCKEGYELNPETGRCRKIKENTGAEYSLITENYTEETSFTAVYAVCGVLALGIMYIIYEFRNEIKKLFRKVFRRFH